MNLIPVSEVELKIETGSAFGYGKTKNSFTLCERPDGAMQIISEEGKCLLLEITQSRRMVTIQESEK